jgi:hypothetical protein
MAHGGPKPVDVLLADLDFLHEYLLEMANSFRSAGKIEDAQTAEDWASLPIEASEKISDLLIR